MRRRSGGTAAFLVSTGLAVLITTGSARAEEAALRYTLDPGGPPISTRGQEMLASDQPIQAVKLPQFRSKKPLYLTVRLGEGPDPTFTFALDESEPGAGYDLLYVDTRHAQDLTETAPYRLTRWQYSRGFKPVRLLIKVGGSPTLYHAAILVQERPTTAEYRLQSWAYYSGEARLGEKSYPVALVDSNGNGLFNDRARGADPESAGDALLFDLNGDGKFEQYEFANPECQDAERRIAVDGHYYDLAIPPDGSSFRVTPTTARLAMLRSGPEPFALLLLSDDGMLPVRGENGQARVPVGDYRIMGWQVEERDRDGSLWKVEGSRERLGGEPRRLSVKADMPLPRLGSPLQAQLQVQPAGGREFDCQLSFTGASGEVIGQVQRNGEPMPEPHMRILDARGIQVADVPFHYG
jgi:hypothetical protein